MSIAHNAMSKIVFLNLNVLIIFINKYTLPQKKRNFSEVAFLFEKSVHHLILDQKSFVECSW